MPEFTNAILITMFSLILVLIVALIIMLLAPDEASKSKTVTDEIIDLKAAPERRSRNLFSIQLGLIILLIFAGLLLSRLSANMPIPAHRAGTFSMLASLKLLSWPTILLAGFVLTALIGLYPMSYLAYKLVVSKSQQKRLQDDLTLLGLSSEEEAAQKAKDLYEDAYSSRQYIVFILLIMLVSTLVVLGFAYPNTLSIAGAEANVLALVFYAYLGAYVFSVQELIRRYNTEDLRPQVYSSMLVRMLVAMVVTFVGANLLLAAGADLSAGTDNQVSGFAQALTQASADLAAAGEDQTAEIAGNIAQAAQQVTENIPQEDAGPAAWPAILAFLIGIFPKSGIDWFQKLTKNILGTPEEVNLLPIRNIQGISTWHEARLAELGIDDVQNLATVDIRKMLLTTRFDTLEMLNWIDQAILYAKVREKYPRFQEASISTFHEFTVRINQIKVATDTDSKTKLATRLSLSEDDLDYLALWTDYPNYIYIQLYNRNSVNLAINRAQAGIEGLVGLLKGAQGDEKQKYEFEAEKYRAQLEQEPNDVDALVNYGIVQFKLQNIEEARQLLMRAIELEPEMQKAYSNLANVYLRLTNWDEAQINATRAIDLDPMDKHAYNYRGIAFMKLGGFEHAIQDFNQALGLSDRYADVYLNRGIAYNALGDFSKAVDDFYRAYYLLSNNSIYDLWIGWGTAYLGVGDQKEQQQPGSGTEYFGLAIDKITHAIASNPDAEDYAKRGYASLQRNRPGDYEHAEQDFLTALKFDPKPASAYDNLGLLRVRTNRLEEAVRYYQKSIEIKHQNNDPSLVFTHFNLAMAYWKSGNYSAACQEFQIVLDKAAGSPDLAVFAQQVARYLASTNCAGLGSGDNGRPDEPIGQHASLAPLAERGAAGPDGLQDDGSPPPPSSDTPPVVKLSAMDSRSETHEYFLQQRDNTEIPVKKKNMYRDPMLEQFESKKVTIEGRSGSGGIEYDTITLRTLGTVPLVAPTSNSITISPGTLGGDVLLLQNRLKELGYDLAADGYFGDRTVDVVKRFQAAHHLNADGVVSPETWEALTAA